MMAMFVVSSCALGAGTEVDLELRTTKPTQVVFEPADFRLVLINRGAKPVSVSPSIDSADRWRIERADGWVDCRSSFSPTPGVGTQEWRRVAPHGEIELSFRPFGCPGNGETASTDFKDWTQVPGSYRLQVEYELAQSAGSTAPPARGKAPSDAVRGRVTSNEVKIDVRRAEGIDAEALNWALENHHNPLDVEVVNRSL